jgi:Glycosyl transferase family 2
VSHSHLAPIALFVYNRPDHLTRVAEALAYNRKASMSKLFIYSDAPKNLAAASQVERVRVFARKIKGFLSVEVIEQSVNQGVARSVMQGVERLTEQFGKVIVLEDDLLPSPHFLGYMNSALDRYESDERVISVHGYSYPVQEKLPETFFLRGADCWGWGTWKRGWDLFESDGRKLLMEMQRRGLTYAFDFDGNYPYTDMLQDCIAGRNDSWAIRWYASAFLLDKLTLYPGCSQIQNIGVDGSGRHLGTTNLFTHRDWGRAVSVEDIPMEESTVGRDSFARFMHKVVHPSPARRLLRSLKKLIAA